MFGVQVQEILHTAIVTIRANGREFCSDFCNGCIKIILKVTMGDSRGSFPVPGWHQMQRILPKHLFLIFVLQWIINVCLLNSKSASSIVTLPVLIWSRTPRNLSFVWRRTSFNFNIITWAWEWDSASASVSSGGFKKSWTWKAQPAPVHQMFRQQVFYQNRQQSLPQEAVGLYIPNHSNIIWYLSRHEAFVMQRCQW